MRSPTGLTLGQRLIALIVAVTALLVVGLAAFFTSRQLAELRRDLEAKADVYGKVVGKQLVSAVAFSDRETAREVLSSIVADHDVVAVQLRGDDQTVLFEAGQVASALPARLEAQTVLTRPGRIVALVPVVSLEGPRGTLVLELSTAGIATSRRRLVVTACAVGLVGLVLASFFAWLIVRRVAGRLGRIAGVATAVAGGDLEQPLVEDRGRDEIGALASAFNAMLTQIRTLIEREHEAARQEQARLEHLVSQRTAALDARTAEMRQVFEQVEQGLLVVDVHGAMSRERSAMVERWLGPAPASAGLADYVARFAPERAAWFTMAWSELAADVLPLELAIDQLPSSFDVDGRTLRWSYKTFTVDGQPRVLVVVTDITDELARERAERDERERMAVVGRLLRDPAGTVAAYRELAELVAAVRAWSDDEVAAWRVVHTLKGAAAMLDLCSIARACHQLERLRAEPDAGALVREREAIAARWAWFDGQCGAYVDDRDGRLDVSQADLGALEHELVRRAPHAELVRQVRALRRERARVPLARLAEQGRALAARLGKPGVVVAVDCDERLRLPDGLAGVWPALGHAVRNALDHGLERADERASAGKPGSGTLRLAAAVEGDALVVTVADDGRGIDWARVAAAARSRGLPSETLADLEAALFADGLSTAATVTDVSGRGVGMSALRDVCAAAGGQLAIESRPGVGTTLRMSWPRGGGSRPLAVIAS